MILNTKIFRAYDIRGEAFVDFDEDGFFVTAAAFGRYIAKKHGLARPHIFVSGDGRNSMPELYPAVIAGIKASGCDVTWGGSIPTPMNYFMLYSQEEFTAAIQISASHNPPKDNGMKFTDTHGAVCGDEIQEILKLAQCETCNLSDFLGECKNQCDPKESTHLYLAKLREITKPQTPKKIIVDCGNAIPGVFYPEILEKFGHTVERLYCDLNPNFPNHQPDPERLENLVDLIQKIKNSNADYGFAFDGDGDRLGIVLSDGTVLSADKILYCLASDFLSRNPNETIVVDAMTSRTLIEKIESIGGKVVVAQTGHSYIHQKMEEVGALLAGEQSGHFMFGENFYGYDDALLAGLRFIEAIETSSDLIQEVTDNWPPLLEFSEKMTVIDEEKFEVLEKIKKEVLEKYPQALTIDGVRVDFSDGEWAIIRCSNTSPKISIRLEMKTEFRLKEMKDYFVGLLEKYR